MINHGTVKMQDPRIMNMCDYESMKLYRIMELWDYGIIKLWSWDGTELWNYGEVESSRSVEL